MWVATRCGTDAKAVATRSRGKGTRVVWAKAILSCKCNGEAPAGARSTAKRCRWDAKRDEARDGIGTDGDGADSCSVRIHVFLSKALHLKQTAPL